MRDWSDVTAIFGGTFDPPHLGHMEAVKGLFTAPRVKQVRVVPSAHPPHKRTMTAETHRVKMTKLAFLRSIDTVVDPQEVERARLTGRPSYTYETLQALRNQIGPELAFVIGTDQLQDLSKWYRFPELLGLSHWIVLERKGQDSPLRALTEWQGSGLIKTQKTGTEHPTFELSAPKPTFLTVVPTPARELSSHKIRERIAVLGDVPAELLSPDVISYLKQNHLYGT